MSLCTLRNAGAYRILLLFLISSFLHSLSHADQQIPRPQPAYIYLKGYLGKEEFGKANQALQALAESNNRTLLIEVNSSSGNIEDVLDFAKSVYTLKSEINLKVIVYIDDKAIGPAAVLPFLADEIYTSIFVSWGDIPLGSEHVIPTNILRNQVVSLIPLSSLHHELLQTLAIGMSDKNAQIIDDNGWKVTAEARGRPLISGNGETLVVNQNQLHDLHITAGGIPLHKFQSLFNVTQAQKELLKEESESSSALAYSTNNLDKRLQDHIKFDPQGPNTVGYIYIGNKQNSINQATWLYVKNALDEYKKTKPDFVILELDTPGGEVFAAEEISTDLKELDTQYGIPVVCFINNWAMSAGAMLAYSCRFIAIVKDASMGAAEPVIMGEGEMKAASEKINSALRADFANRARYFDRNPYIAEAMVDKDVILVIRHGEIFKLESESQIRITGPHPDVVISPKGKLLTLNAEQLMKYGVADILLPPVQTSPISEQEKEAGQWPLRKTLLGQYPFFKQIPEATVEAYTMDWKARFFALLANPLVSSLLVLGVMIGFYVELSTPGFGIAGSVGLICLILIILSSFALEIANWLEVILLFIGLAIIAVDVFVLPTFGLLGFAGVVFFLIGLFGMLLPGAGSIRYEFDTQTFNAAGQVFFERLAWLCGTLVVGTGIILALARYLTPTLAGYSRLVLTGHEQDASKGYIASENPANLPQPGSKGEVLAHLRPAGKVIINDKIYDAISARSFIDKGTPIVVEKLDGSVIVVNTIEGEPENQP